MSQEIYARNNNFQQDSYGWQEFSYPPRNNTVSVFTISSSYASFIEHKNAHDFRSRNYDRELNDNWSSRNNAKGKSTKSNVVTPSAECERKEQIQLNAVNLNGSHNHSAEKLNERHNGAAWHKTPSKVFYSHAYRIRNGLLPNEKLNKINSSSNFISHSAAKFNAMQVYSTYNTNKKSF